METDELFLKIINQEIPADIVYQDDHVTAFKDIRPQAPVHILIIPNYRIPTVNEVTEKDVDVLGRLFLCAKELASKMKIANDGYRLIINCNRHAGQEVFHLHMHLLAGAHLGPMLSLAL